MNALPRALIMAGGTGGHVYPALAVAQGLRERGWQVDWVGTQRGLEARVVPSNGLTLHTLPVRGLRGKGLLFSVQSVLRLLWSVPMSIVLLAKLKPSVVLGMGGYAAGPAGFAAWLLRRPLVIHEQNAVAGTTNRWLAPLARRILCGLPGAFPTRADTQVPGNPLRADFVTRAEQPRAVPDSFTPDRPLRLLVLGGSLGSMPLNRAVPEALATLSESARQRLTIRHQCGEAHLSVTRELYGELSASVEPFIDDMASAYLEADLVICRAGALTISELAVTATPAILVPLPHAIDDHQTRNAQVLSSHDAAQLLPQKEMTPTRLGELIGSCLQSPSRLVQLSDNARALAHPKATEAVIAVLEEVARVA